MIVIARTDAGCFHSRGRSSLARPPSLSPHSPLSGVVLPREAELRSGFAVQRSGVVVVVLEEARKGELLVSSIPS